MTNHAVKEEIINPSDELGHGCLTGDCHHEKQLECDETLRPFLCVEVEDGLPKWVGTITKSMDFGIPPIAIGDTVYQGEEWFTSSGDGHDRWHLKSDFDNAILGDWIFEPPETMPIELAAKTFKVVGVEVEEKKKTKRKWQSSVTLYKKKWFWSYKLEEMKG